MLYASCCRVDAVLQLEMLAVALVCSYSLFLVQSQHAFEGVYLENEPKYNRTDAAAKGASCIIIPWWWRWATTGVEYHHIHHLNARVPGYRIKVSHALLD
jgi:omega-6 fatty acid desaturase (delta-12 desaturase)